jgi:hypothetical protein
MKNKSIKEQLSIGTDPSSYVMSKTPKPSFITNGGFHSNADSVYAQRLAMVNEDDEDSDSEEVLMPEDIFEFRVYKDNRYQLCETLERIDEGIFQTIADIAKAIPGLDQIVGDIELYLQAGNVGEAYDDLSKIVSSLSHASGMSALGVIGTQQQFNDLLNTFMTATEEDKSLLKQGVEGLLELLKQMTITAIQTFDSVVALPSFVGTPVAGAIGEVIANVATSLGSFLRDQPVEKFVFQTISARSGIVAKIVEIFEKVMSTINSANPFSQSLLYIVEKISKTGGEIVKMFLLKPFELLRRLGDLYKASIGQAPELASVEFVNSDEAVQTTDSVASEEQQIQIAENRRSHSILFLLEGFDDNKLTSEKKGFTKKYDDHEKLKGKQKKGLPDHLQKAIIGSSKNEAHYDDDKESFEEIDLAEFSGVASIGGGPALPLGQKPKYFDDQKKALEEQRKRIALLQIHHQRTTNKLK